MKEILRDPSSAEEIKKGDVLLVLQQGEEEERAGTVDNIDSKGRAWMNYGGYVTPLHDKDQIRIPPEDIREALALRLKQQNEEMRESLQKAMAPLVEALTEYHKANHPFGWLRDLFKR